MTRQMCGSWNARTGSLLLLEGKIILVLVLGSLLGLLVWIGRVVRIGKEHVVIRERQGQYALWIGLVPSGSKLALKD